MCACVFFQFYQYFSQRRSNSTNLEMVRTRVSLDLHICDGGDSCFLLIISLSMKPWCLHWTGSLWRRMTALCVLYTVHNKNIVTFSYHYLLIKGYNCTLSKKMVSISSWESFSRKIFHTSLFIVSQTVLLFKLSALGFLFFLFVRYPLFLLSHRSLGGLNSIHFSSNPVS